MRPIDADELLDRVEWANTNPLLNHGETAVKLINAAPTIDPVKHGKWVNDNGLYKCTSCNDHCTVAGWADCIPEEQMYKAFKFCPNCGAKMGRSEE